MDSVPTRDEINVYDSLDERWAVKNFLGKDLVQAEAMFRENFLHYQEDLMWMGPRAFCFYVPAAIAYLLSPAANDDADAVSSFCSLIEYRLEYGPEEVEPVKPLLRGAVDAMLNGFARFQYDPAIYGDLERRYRSLYQRLSS